MPHAEIPAPLRDRMLAATPAAMAEAALQSLRTVLQDCEGPDAALELLSADALLTQACGDAAQQGAAELMQLVSTFDAARFQQLLDQSK